MILIFQVCFSKLPLKSLLFFYSEIMLNTLSGLPQKLQNQIPGLSRTFLDDFPGLFQDCARFFLQDLKFNFHYYSCMHPLFVLVIKENFNATHLDF